MTIKAHCMGAEFPKRDAFDLFLEAWAKKLDPLPMINWRDNSLPAVADLDAVAEEQRVKEATAHALELAGRIKEQTSGKTDRSQP